MADILALAKDTANMEEGRHRLVFIFGDKPNRSIPREYNFERNIFLE